VFSAEGKTRHGVGDKTEVMIIDGLALALALAHADSACIGISRSDCSKNKRQARKVGNPTSLGSKRLHLVCNN